MKCNFTAKNNLKAMSLIDFWTKYVYIYRSVGTVAIRTLLRFHRLTYAKVAFLPKYKDKT